MGTWCPCLGGTPRAVAGVSGKWLAASYPDSPASLWSLDLRVWMELACRIANRELEPNEWREMVGPFPYEKTCSVDGSVASQRGPLGR